MYNCIEDGVTAITVHRGELVLQRGLHNLQPLATVQLEHLQAKVQRETWAPEFGGRKWVPNVRDWPSQNGVFVFG